MNEASPVGRWLTKDGDGVIEIAPCGAGLCGRIVGIALSNPWGPIPKDWQGRSQCGLTIIEGMARDGDTWRGSILDPRNGARYHATLRLDPQGRLLLRGYLLTPLFGQTQVWTPYPGVVPSNCRMEAPAAHAPRIAR